MLKLFKHFKVNKILLTSLFIIILLKTVGILYLPTLTARIINTGVIKGDISHVLKTGGVMIAVAIFTGVLAILSTYFSANLSSTLSRDIRNKLFSHVQKLSIHDFKAFSTSSLITRCTSDVNQLENTVNMFFEMIVPVPFITLIGMLLALSKDIYMALVICVTGAAFIIFNVIISKKIMNLSLSMQTKLDKINSQILQYISGIRVIRAFNRDKHENRLLNETFTSYADVNIKMNKILAVAMPGIMVIMNLCAVAILWFGSIRISNGKMLLGDIMAVIEYSIIIFVYLVMAVIVLLNVPRASVCSKRILEVLEYEPEIVDEKTTESIPKGRKTLEFRNVTFSYRDAEKPVLNNISFLCQSGKTTAIIGATGSGKSTIGKLIPRLHEIQGGEILINGINIREFSQENLRDMISFSPQKSFLFSGTIANNIRHGKKDATMKEIKNAAKIAQADNFISELNGDYNSFVAQGGSNFSGGQRQRICIARTLVKKSDIYVFDDSFSALDYKTDAKLREALKSIVKDSIVITIAQRISTIMEADQIIVLEEGKIVGIGTHSELVKNCPIYIKIAKSQLSEEELAC
ncbi:ABC transporter ATP-binding protein [Clostridium magnum]|uniref:Lipid A export ATP-binding/permease protein MsbA n=1 Tax=Clostridium magnum DSM 2767 TaxID=1121326 RepID=A0A162UK43_9CLOT|nr:ABC transporter ATP-binding protein [Clostridium magnum]KZL94011.1 lipid A export ATP-binding/permease protein MsbA [Clostridium magnum DSM 2767]SHI00347.1 ATP-binding cassette, subfamily B [Clostridium magnum DSM 2767]